MPVLAPEEKLVSDTIDSQQANYLADVRQMTAVVGLPRKQRRAAYAALLDASAPNTKDGARALSFFLLPSCPELDDDEVRLKARDVITLAAIAMMTAKAQRRVFPNALPPQFVDPFTDKPLGYRREGTDGFIVYSAGPSGTYAGSKPGAKAPPTESEFRYPPTPLPIAPDVLK